MIRDRDIKETKFEEDLKLYFPDIYKIHEAGKYDKYIWEVFTCMMGMIDSNGYGEIKVTYQSGRINRVATTIINTSDSKKSNLSYPGVI